MLDPLHTVNGRQRSSVAEYWLAALFLVLSFVPYVAVPLGSSTNVSVASMAALALALPLARSPKLLVLMVITSILPFVASLLRLLFEYSGVNANAYFTSIFSVMTFFGAASSVAILRERAVPLLSLCITASSGVAIIQKFVFLDNGIVPWIQLYAVPGYASVASNATVIGLYIRRPFGLFPEPSFLAGTLALASAGLLILVSQFALRMSFPIIVSLLLATLTMFLSDSGSGIVCIVLLAIAVLIPFVKRNRFAILLVPVTLASAVGLGLSIAASRQNVGNTSWNDRFVSIIGGANLWTTDPVTFLLGVGRGMVPSYFQNGRVAFGGMTVFSDIPDIYSVLGRVILENGFIFGLSFIIGLALCILRCDGRQVTFLGFLCAVLWFVVAGLTISYETAAWIWILPGICLGCRISPKVTEFEESGTSIENPARR